MRRSLFIVLALVGMLLALSAAPALATVHPLVCSERSAEPANDAAALQDPPGITPGGPDSSRADTAQPVFAVIAASGPSGGKSFNAFKPEGC